MTKYLDNSGLERFFDNIKGLMRGPSYQQIETYLDAHPEATTTIQNRAVSTEKLGNKSVTTLKLGEKAVTTQKIDNSAVTTIKLSDGAVTDAKLATQKVNQPLFSGVPTNGTSGQVLRTLGDGTTEWATVGLPSEAQTSAALSEWLEDHPDVTTTVQDNSITLDKLSPALANSIPLIRISDAEIQQIVNEFDNKSIPSPVYAYDTAIDMQADPDLAINMIVHTNGFSTSGDGKAAWYKIKSSGTVNGSTILALQNGLKAIQISENNSVTTTDIQDDAVTSAKIADDSVITAKIIDNAVTTAKIEDSSVTANKLANDAIDAMPTMTTSSRGVAKVGAGLAMNGDALELDGSGDIATAVTSWLNAHPEATTTVENGAITEEKLGSVLMKSLLKGRGYVPDAVNLTDADNAERNSVVQFKNAEDVDHLPTVERCMLVTVGNGVSTSAESSPAVQLCVTTLASTSAWTPRMWVRGRWGSSSTPWSAWYECIMSDDGSITVTTDDIQDGSITNAKLATTLFRSLLMGQGYINDSEIIYDANHLARNTIYFLSTAGTCLNVPSGETGGFIVTLGNGVATSDTSVAAQIFLSTYNKTTTWSGKAYFRARYGSSTSVWSEWSEVLDKASSLFDDYSDLSMFTRVGVLGDSYASGAIHFSDENISAIANYAQSWPMNLHRQCGCDIVRYSYPGWSTYSFVTSTAEHYADYGLEKLVNDAATTPCGLYICCFGINDSNSQFDWGGVTGGAAYLGTIADINDNNPSLNANSFYGNYGRIISAIRQAAPNALVVLGTTYHRTGTRYAGYNVAVQEIAEHFGIEWIDFTSDPFMTSDYYNACYQGGHPTAQMYAGIAKAVNRLVVGRMRANPAYFNDYPGC